ncbi:unnamed protein product [Moneuplotes crassus]|uniref:Uncharacterized protein n=1 Tax=Euplotes crassus TaxID=5936 RepID=A0AAD1UKQ4_EUPCR|nr:unnamed protein product [Moneuplotes crassus]
MQNNTPKALDFFGFIGLFPGGIRQAELTHIWNDNSWIGYKDELIRASLLVYKKNSQDEFVFSLLPFMTIRACEYLDSDTELKSEYHSMACQLYLSECQSIYEADKSIETVQKFTEIETNVWACMYRAVASSRVSSKHKLTKSITDVSQLSLADIEQYLMSPSGSKLSNQECEQQLVAYFTCVLFQ